MKKKIILTVLAVVLLIIGGYFISQNVGNGITPTPESTLESTSESTLESTSESILESTPESISEPTSEITSKVDISVYENVPNDRFPVPMQSGEIVPYDWFSLPREIGDYSLTFGFTDMNLLKIYKDQLREAGFTEVEGIDTLESFWLLDIGNEETLGIEIRSGEGESGREEFAISMCKNTFD